MYRDDQEATFARLQVIQKELETAQTEGAQDKQKIAQLQAQLAATQQALARLGGQMPYQTYTLAPRAGAILTLGILSLAVCGLLGPIAWSMGNEELRRIDAGLTAPDGRSTASAGRICGIIASSFLMLGGFFILLALMMATGH